MEQSVLRPIVFLKKKAQKEKTPVLRLQTEGLGIAFTVNRP